MRIDHLHLRNFKGFEDSQFDFPRSADAPGSNGSFHLLIGGNATGKTSALDALAVAAGAWFLGVPEAVSRTIRGEDIRVKVSHGQRNMVAMIGDMAYRAAQLNPHLGAEVLAKTPGIVLIDELELHLHPHWQRRVVQDLQGLFPEVQFFASTHSPQIVGHLPSRWLHLLQRDRAGQIVQVPASQSLGMDSNWILEQIMDTPERESATGGSLIGSVRCDRRGGL